MTDAAGSFLEAWALEHAHTTPLSDTDAAMLAEQWESDAQQNGIATADLRSAAGGDVAAFLQRTFGREGSELALD